MFGDIRNLELEDWSPLKSEKLFLRFLNDDLYDDVFESFGRRTSTKNVLEDSWDSPHQPSFDPIVHSGQKQ